MDEYKARVILGRGAFPQTEHDFTELDLDLHIVASGPNARKVVHTLISDALFTLEGEADVQQ